MKYISPSFEIWEQEDTLLGVYQAIEKAGRVCYKSEDNITKDSAIKFITMLDSKQHLSPLEHGTIYLFIPSTKEKTEYNIAQRYKNNKYSKIRVRNDSSSSEKNGYYVTTNYRVLKENDWIKDLQYLSLPTEEHYKRITVKFICDRGITHEFVRHRVFSFCQESSRYCNYSKGKFGGVTYIKPCWYDKSDPIARETFDNALEDAETMYLLLINSSKWTPQQARNVLPNATKTELVMTGFIEDWKHFFDLRCSQAAHPQARELAIPLYEEFIKRKFI